MSNRLAMDVVTQFWQMQEARDLDKGSQVILNIKT